MPELALKEFNRKGSYPLLLGRTLAKSNSSKFENSTPFCLTLTKMFKLPLITILKSLNVTNGAFSLSAKS